LLSVAEPEFQRDLFDDRTLAALDYADVMTASDLAGDFVTDDVFAAVKANYGTEEIVVLTELIAWENASARFNRALGVQSQYLWKQ
jgi:alkylhydroperoxidase family enzyme